MGILEPMWGPAGLTRSMPEPPRGEVAALDLRAWLAPYGVAVSFAAGTLHVVAANRAQAREVRRRVGASWRGFPVLVCSSHAQGAGR